MISSKDSKVKYVFFDNPKCGSSSIRKILLDNFGKENDSTAKHTKIIRYDYKHLNNESGNNNHKLILSDDVLAWAKTQNSQLKNYTLIERSDFINNYFNVALIRNPFSRIFSLFKYKLFKGEPYLRKCGYTKAGFEIFLKRYLVKNEPTNSESLIKNMVVDTYSSFSEINLDHIDYFIEYDNFVEDVIGCFNHLNILLNPEDVPHILKSRKEDSYKNYYTKTSKLIIESLYRDELNYFNYNF